MEVGGKRVGRRELPRRRLYFATSLILVEIIVSILSVNSMNNEE